MADRFPTVSRNDLPSGEHSCSICQEDYSREHKPVRLPCLHVFCRVCISAWLREHSTCPVCRTDILSSETEYTSSGHSSSHERSRHSPRDESSRFDPRRHESSVYLSRYGSSRYEPSRSSSTRHSSSARPTTHPGTSRAPTTISVSSSQWDETLRPSRSSHRNSHLSRDESRTSALYSRLSEATITRSRSGTSSRHSSRRSGNYSVPPFTRERLNELYMMNTSRCSLEELEAIGEQLRAADAREARGEPVFESTTLSRSCSTRESGHRNSRPSRTISTIREEESSYGGSSRRRSRSRSQTRRNDPYDSVDSERTLRPSSSRYHASLGRRDRDSIYDRSSRQRSRSRDRSNRSSRYTSSRHSSSRDDAADSSESERPRRRVRISRREWEELNGEVEKLERHMDGLRI